MAHCLDISYVWNKFLPKISQKPQLVDCLSLVMSCLFNEVPPSQLQSKTHLTFPGFAGFDTP